MSQQSDKHDREGSWKWLTGRRKRRSRFSILVDLLRQAGQFHQARQLILTKRAAITDNTILKILDFQDILAFKGDIACHTTAEAPKEDE